MVLTGTVKVSISKLSAGRCFSLCCPGLWRTEQFSTVDPPKLQGQLASVYVHRDCTVHWCTSCWPKSSTGLSRFAPLLASSIARPHNASLPLVLFCTVLLQIKLDKSSAGVFTTTLCLYPGEYQVSKLPSPCMSGSKREQCSERQV